MKLWQEILKIHANNSVLMQKFYTLKFVDAINKLSIPDNLSFVQPSSLNGILNSFRKLRANLQFSQFTLILFPIDNLQKAIDKVFGLLECFDVSGLSKSLFNDYYLFLEQFLYFLNFYRKYLTLLEYKRYTTKEIAVQEFFTAVSELDHFTLN